jgi:hypothetical protein
MKSNLPDHPSDISSGANCNLVGGGVLNTNGTKKSDNYSSGKDGFSNVIY